MQCLLTDIVRASSGRLLQGDASKDIVGVCTDSRTLRPGELFVALRGPCFDGHHFCATAVEKGAAAVVVEHPVPLSKDIPVLVVADTLAALGDMAHEWRARFSVPCVAITGSNGKSTTKEMTAAVVQAKGPVLATEGNFNNLVGLPLTLFRWNASHVTAVLEMGMNAPGEIKRLAEIAQPTIGLITNITAAHLEKLGTVEAVARAKGELFEAMGQKGTLIVNDEDPWVKRLALHHRGRFIRFGMGNHCEVRFGHMETEGLGSMRLRVVVGKEEVTLRLPVTGVHNVMNAMAALAVGCALNLEAAIAAKHLEHFRPMAMRFEQIQLANGVRLVNDAYNANPESMKAALRTVGLAKRAGRFFAVLGDMLELGESAGELHEEVGSAAVKAGTERLFVYGNFADATVRGAKGQGMTNGDASIHHDFGELARCLIKEMRTGDIVLVKGSRGMHLERLVDMIRREIGSG